jgi:hypothetical protein
VRGDLTIHSESFEIWHSGLLPAVTRIEGNLSIEATSFIEKVLLSLDEVTGTVRFERILGRICPLVFTGGMLMPNLRRIGGDLVSQGCSFPVTSAGFSQLASVGGSFRILGEVSGGAVRLGRCDAPPLSLGSLEISGSALTQIPLATNVAVGSTGSVTISGNTRLCQCHVDEFISELSWSGSAVTSGNGACDASCPSLLRCP